MYNAYNIFNNYYKQQNLLINLNRHSCYTSFPDVPFFP